MLPKWSPADKMVYFNHTSSHYRFNENDVFISNSIIYIYVKWKLYSNEGYTFWYKEEFS